MPATTETQMERRVLSPEDIELRVEGDENPKMTGYAAKFSKWSEDLGWFREKIRSGAFDDAIAESDVRCLKNHDPNLILGRTTSKTLRLVTNSVGLKFENDVPDTTTGRDTVEEIRRGDISGCSFSFTTAEDDWKYLEDGSVERTIIKVAKLFDVGPVTYPAYPDTTVAARSLEAHRPEGWTARATASNTCATSVAEPPEEAPEEVTEESTDAISPERQREIGRDYRKAGRIMNRCRSAED